MAGGQRTRMDLQAGDRTEPDVAPVPARESHLPQAGGERGAASIGSAGRRGATARPQRPVSLLGADAPALPRAGATRGYYRAIQLCLAVLFLVALAGLAYHFDTTPRHQAVKAVPDTFRALLATALVFGITGFGLVRLLLPVVLRRYELLWVLPTGGCATGLVMTVLAFAGVPYAISLISALVAGAALSGY